MTLRTLLLSLTAFVMLFGFLGRPALAHDGHYSTVTIRLDTDGLRLSLTVPTASLKQALPGRTTWDTAAFEAHVIPLLGLTADGRALNPTVQTVQEAAGGQALLAEARLDWKEMPRTLRITRPFTTDTAGRTLLSLFESGDLKFQDILDQRRPALDYAVGKSEHPSIPLLIARFVPAGVQHIFTGPDHILFLVGLLLLGGSLKRLLKIVTAFTVAHSITLALAALDIYCPPARFIEPMIALSIICVGLDNLAFKSGERDMRALLAFGFGFIHGFGFAEVLRAAALPREALAASLLAFNGGVEIGQTCIVLIVAPLLAWVAKKNAVASRRVLVIGSVGVALMGAFWFVQRVLAG